jgi:hypothetical protein
MQHALQVMENMTFAQIQAIVDKEKRARELATARYKKWKEANPEKHREKSRIYMRAYYERKRQEKAAAQKQAEKVHPDTKADE